MGVVASPRTRRIGLGRDARWGRWRSGVDVGGRDGVDRRAGRRRAIHGLGREREGVQDLTDLSGILHGGDQAQASPTSRASEDVELERTMHELGP